MELKLMESYANLPEVCGEAFSPLTQGETGKKTPVDTKSTSSSRSTTSQNNDL